MSQDKAKVSIIMGIYNCEQYLDDALNSIAKQTYDNWELIICDDCSTDKTYEVARKFRDDHPNKVTLLRNGKNLKLNKTLNRCLKHAKGEFIARMDGDDICDPQRLKEEIVFLQSHPQYDLVSCQMSLFNDSGVYGRANFPIGEVKKQDLLFGSPFCHAGMLMKKTAMDELKGYSVGEEYIRVEDYDLWFRFYDLGKKGYNLSKVLYSMRDDDSAQKRRTWQNRYNEYTLKRKIFKTFKLPFYLKTHIYRPIILYLLPAKVYSFLRKRNVR